MKILITGSAGFIGFHLVKKLIFHNFEIIGLDNINSYYNENLKFARLEETGIYKSQIEYNKLINSNLYQNYRFIKLNIEDKDNLNNLFKKEKFDVVCHLAAQAGVRYSLENPYVYIESNIVGFFNILENCKNNNIEHLIFASSSSVYGKSNKLPYSESDIVDKPVSLYAATKISNELMAYTYGELYNLKTTALRFFTVYGPWGRPDMAPMLFTDAVLNNKSINVFNNGDLSRDFTYIDDIIEGIIKVLKGNFKKKIFEIFNIGCSNPVKLIDFISVLEDQIGKKVKKVMLPMQKGDVYHTYADTSKIESYFGYKPKTSINEGVKFFVEWYLDKYIKIK